MKGKIIIPLALCSLILTACGSGAKNEGAAYITAEYDNYSYAETSSADAGGYEYAEAETPKVLSNTNDTENGLSAEKIKREMLVYTCNMTVDVLDFDAAIGKFKDSLNSFGGFVETESYNDGGSSSRWYNADMEKWQSYSATVRIPSADYDNFCAAAAELGELRSKNASVENVSSEYYDLSTTLEIYEAKEERYIALLADITDDEYAVTVERELTDLQIEIAKIKTRMNEIRTDVAYSFVNISINEVKEYTAEPVKTDTFGQRLMNTLSETGANFLVFLEDLLFFIIAVFPYLLLIGIIVFIIVAIVKSSKKKKAAKKAKAAASEMNTAAPNEEHTEKKTEEKNE